MARQAPEASRDQVDTYLKNALEQYSRPDSRAWPDRMYRFLKENRDPEATARTLRQQDGFSVGVEKMLMSVWMAGTALRFSGAPGKAREDLLVRAVDAVRAAGHARWVTQMVVDLVEDNSCDQAFLDALLKDLPNPLAVGIDAASSTSCARWWLVLHARFPQNRVIRFALSQTGFRLPLAEKLALFQGLDSPSLLFDYVSTLWEAGLIAEGLEVFDAAPAADRAMLLNDQRLPSEIVVDGVSVGINHEIVNHPLKRFGDFRLDHVAALSLTGRVADARNAFERLPYTKELRPRWDCLDLRLQKPGQCDDNYGVVQKWRLLESTLNRPNEDPYLLIEAGDAVVRSALWVESLRRRLTGNNYGAYRRGLAESWAQQHRRDPRESVPVMAEDIRQRAATYTAKIRTAHKDWNVDIAVESTVRANAKPTPPSLPSGFREVSLPDFQRTVRGKSERAPVWPAGMAELPEGFGPVRVERGTPFTIAVSLSQNLDPVGEVSAGAYWIHLSRDGGATWNAPLYTGLLQYFPYVVPETSKLPLSSADGIALEVEIQQLDPSSISYPPVSLRSSRRSPDFYLEIPLTALAADRDRDGLTDIVEDHLLLNKDRKDSDGDGVEDGADRLPNVKNSNASSTAPYMTQILQAIIGHPEDALIEPVDRAPVPLFQASPAGVLDRSRPLLVAGRPQDFSAVRMSTAVFVYSEADVARLLSHSPAFNPLSLGPIVFNRAQDRGFVSWTQQWRGGTLRLLRERRQWRVEVIASWVS